MKIVTCKFEYISKNIYVKIYQYKVRRPIGIDIDTRIAGVLQMLFQLFELEAKSLILSFGPYQFFSFLKKFCLKIAQTCFKTNYVVILGNQLIRKDSTLLCQFKNITSKFCNIRIIVGHVDVNITSVENHN